LKKSSQIENFQQISVLEQFHFAYFLHAADIVQNCHRNSGIEVYLHILHNFRLNPSTEYSEHFKHVKQYR